MQQIHEDAVKENPAFDKYGQRNCAKLLCFFQRVEGLLKKYSGKDFHSLRVQDHPDQSLNILLAAVKELQKTMPAMYVPTDIEVSRNWQKMSLADIEA